MLHSIRLVDFANHRDTRLTFGRMTALIGPNGAGKTGILRAIVEAANARKAGQIFQSATPARRSRKTWILTADWQGEFDHRKGMWGLVAESNGANLYFRTGECHDDWVPLQGLEVPVNSSPEPWSASSVYRDIVALHTEGHITPVSFEKAQEWSASYIKTNSSVLSGPSYSETIPPILGQDGREFAWVISYLRDTNPDKFQEIENALREIVPAVYRVRTQWVKVPLIKQRELSVDDQMGVFSEQMNVIGRELVFDMTSGKDIPATAVSEGTLISFFIFTAILYPGFAGEVTVLLDDIEQGLHPGAQQRLIRLLRRLQEARPNIQIILSTHSPYIVNEFDAKDIWVLGPDSDGISHCARLDSHPDAEQALRVLTTGEFWSSEGESWVPDLAKEKQEPFPTTS